VQQNMQNMQNMAVPSKKRKYTIPSITDQVKIIAMYSCGSSRSLSAR